jgi:UDP-N-acetylglucosamine diphosphorylase/glucosamine-1-phosphate N-acetyltransferase
MVYDDGGGRWGPVVDLRPIFDLRMGSVTIAGRIERVMGQGADGLWVPGRLAAVVREGHGSTAVNEWVVGEDWVLVNGRWAGVVRAERVMGLGMGQALVQGDGQVVAARMTGQAAREFAQSGWRDVSRGMVIERVEQRLLMERPWHVLDGLAATLWEDLGASDLPLARGEKYPGMTMFGEHAVRIGERVRIMPATVIDSTYGPVVIEEGAEINPFVELQGPCYVGVGTILVSHTSIRRNTVLGPGCKIGGEVSATIIQGNSNKAHRGFLGDCIVGSWCNLGAETNVSNLKNTYGSVRVKLDCGHEAEETGRQFHGPIVGDFVRTAIGTRLLTGSVVGTGCMLAMSGFSPKFCGAFGFYTDEGRREHEVEKMLETGRMMMSRRGRTMTGAVEGLLRELAERGCGCGEKGAE